MKQSGVVLGIKELEQMLRQAAINSKNIVVKYNKEIFGSNEDMKSLIENSLFVFNSEELMAFLDEKGYPFDSPVVECSGEVFKRPGKLLSHMTNFINNN